MIKRSIVAIATTLSLSALPTATVAASLDEGFKNPTENTKPWCYWYWLDNDITKDGVTKDLETMAKVGINRAMIGNIMGGGPVKMFSPEWYSITRHALKEAHRLSIDITMFNGPGWSQSGGPWIKPEQSMRRVSWHEYPAKGGTFSQKVRPANIPQSQDIAVLAVPELDAISVIGKKRGNALSFSHTGPFAARALVVHGKAKGKLYALENGKRRLVAAIHAAGGSKKTDFLPNGIESFGFKEARTQEFELVPAPKCKVVLTSAPMVAQVIEKQLGRVHPTPTPTWKSYIFPDSVEPDDPSTIIPRESILNLTKNMDASGVLNCTLPTGNWTVIYFGMVTTGVKNSPAPEEATGLECDKLSRVHTEHHFNAMFGKLLREISPDEKSAFKGITIDSYEKGAQNWTDGFAPDFEKRNGYDPISMLPVMTGRVIDSARTSDQFLWDLRRTVSDMISEYYIAGLREISHKHGLTLWCENYGHWGFPGDFLSYGGQSDEVGGEFWSTGTLGAIECRAASSAAHIYGKRRVYAEAYTSKINLGHHPYTFKARGEELFCEGINHFVLHVYAHQPRDGAPGKNPWFGTAFHRNTPWFTQSRDWVSYLQRCHYMLQQGTPLADVAVYIGDFAPQMTGPANPVAAGYDYDYIGSDAILRKLHVVDGEWVVYDEHKPGRIAARWQVLALPKAKYLRPQVLKKLDTLKKQGGKFIDAVPVGADALQDIGISPIVSETSCPVRWKARQLDSGGMIFFLSNFKKPGTFEATLRVYGTAPELFNPVTGRITKLARYKPVNNGTKITINVHDQSDSCFIVFRNKPSQPSVVSVQLDGKDIPPADLALCYDQTNKLTAESSNPGSYALTLSDESRRQAIIKHAPQSHTINSPWRSTRLDENGFTVSKETTFDLPQSFGNHQRIKLDLGKVSVMAKVKLNGKVYDTLWMPPFALDVTDTLKPGKNSLQITVTSTSNNKPSLGEVKLHTTSTVIIQ
ncbi:MAG: hypothetical protein H7A51_15220 [Akkermansiaceae bacterium]|nr:hypothetical protein [Akkermansiaceae bacterium]